MFLLILPLIEVHQVVAASIYGSRGYEYFQGGGGLMIFI